jgi:hypothetical protein
MKKVTATASGPPAGADYIEMTCEHGTTYEFIDPPDGGARMIDALHRVHESHRRDLGCDCQLVGGANVRPLH